MTRRLFYDICREAQGQTVLEFLRDKGYSRRILSQIKETPGGLLLDGAKPFGSTRLSAGSRLEVTLTEGLSGEKLSPSPVTFGLLYEDEDLLVVNKPANTPIHPSPGNYGNTLADGVAWYFQQKGEALPFRCINRLDRDTTGALILAKHSLAASLLGNQMKNRLIRRTYLALACGCTPKEGVIDAPIGRLPGSALLRQVDFSHGEPARTHYRRLDYQNGLSLVELSLETGRTHQIRVHLAHIGHPLPGDYLYHPDYRQIARQPLHSYQLCFTHPITGRPLLFTAPVPEDMVSAFLSRPS